MTDGTIEMIAVMIDVMTDVTVEEVLGCEVLFYFSSLTPTEWRKQHPLQSDCASFFNIILSVR